MHPDLKVSQDQKILKVLDGQSSVLVKLTKTTIRGDLSYIVDLTIIHDRFSNVELIDIGYISENRIPLSNGQQMVLWEIFDRDGDSAGPPKRKWQDALIQLIRYFA